MAIRPNSLSLNELEILQPNILISVYIQQAFYYIKQQELIEKEKRLFICRKKKITMFNSLRRNLIVFTIW